MPVCTGAFILSRAGLTCHKRLTSHPGAVDSLQRFGPPAMVLTIDHGWRVGGALRVVKLRCAAPTRR